MVTVDPRQCRDCGHPPADHERSDACERPGCGCTALRLIVTLDDAKQAIQDGVDDWEVLTYNLARNDLPAVLAHLCDGYRFQYGDPRRLAKALTDAWVMCEFPENKVERERWLEWFAITGYIENGRPSQPPGSIVLFRGGGPDPNRMAWTSDRRVAEWFRDRFTGGCLWTTTAHSANLLAHVNAVRLDESGRSEDEYVVNPEGLTFTKCDSWLSRRGLPQSNNVSF